MDLVVFLNSLFKQYVAVAMFPFLEFVEVHRFNQFGERYALVVVLKVSL